MRRRALALVIAVAATGALALGPATAANAGGKKKPPACAGKTKKKAIKNITTAYDHFLNGAKYPNAEDKAPYVQLLSGKDLNEEFLAAFEASSAANAAAAATTSVEVDKVTCTGKKTADVNFTLVLGGERAEGLAPPGGAIIADGIWKVTGVTVCNLQALGDPAILETEPCATVVAEA
jgi:hypothetical protein